MLKPWLRITRLPLAPTAICDSAACALLALGAAGRPLSTFGASDWLLLAATSLLTYMAGMAANDLADRHVDARKDPARPLPAGDLKPAAVTVVVVLLAAGAVALGGGPVGDRRAAIAAVALAFFYDFFAKRFFVGGAVAMGAVRCANASLAVWPLVLSGAAPPAVLLGPAFVGLYSGAVTVLSTTEEQHSDRRLWIARCLSAAAFIGAATLVGVLGGVLAVGVMIAFGVASSTLFGRTPRTTMVRHGEKILRPVKAQVLEMLLGLYFLAAVLAGGGHDGTLDQAWTVSFAAAVVAWLLAIGSQLMIRMLRK